MKTFSELVTEQRLQTKAKNKIIYKIFEALQTRELDLGPYYETTLKCNNATNALSLSIKDLNGDTYTLEIRKED